MSGASRDACQDFSVAGKRAGITGYRGTLFWEIIRIAKILRPPWGLFENVPGLLSSHRGRDFWAVLQGLRECWPAVGWRILDSQHFGVPQRRRRVFLVGGPSVEAVRAVLFEPEGGGGDSPAGDQAAARTAGPLGGGAYGAGRRDEDDPNLVMSNGVVNALPSDHNLGARRDQESMLVTHTLRASGHDGSEDGTGRGTPLVVRAERGRMQGDSWSEAAFPLHAAKGPSEQQAVAMAGLVRRLTPLEAERLQAFPDGWTCLCQPLTAYADDSETASEQCRCPDGPRYRAMGNAVTTSVVLWLGRRLLKAMTP